MLNTDKELKLYYSIAEVADMFGGYFPTDNGY